MKLEQAIQQKTPFQNEWHKLSVNLIYTYNWMMEQHRYFLKIYDITGQQFNVLRILRGADQPLSTSEIRERMLDKMSDTSRIVDRLCEKELVNSCKRVTDRRLVDVTISEKGLELLSQIDARMGELNEVMNNLSEDEATMMNDLLDKLRENRE